MGAQQSAKKERPSPDGGPVSRILRLALLAPNIVKAILGGWQPKGLRLAEMLGNGLLNWDEQQSAWD